MGDESQRAVLLATVARRWGLGAYGGGSRQAPAIPRFPQRFRSELASERRQPGLCHPRTSAPTFRMTAPAPLERVFAELDSRGRASPPVLFDMRSKALKPILLKS